MFSIPSDSFSLMKTHKKLLELSKVDQPSMYETSGSISSLLWHVMQTKKSNVLQKQRSQMFFKYVFLKISQYSQENTKRDSNTGVIL